MNNSIKNHYGLIFERHEESPVPLFNFKIKKGRTISLIKSDFSEQYIVEKANNNDLICKSTSDGKKQKFNLQDVTVVSNNIDELVPYLKYVDSVSTNNKKYEHVLVESENYHALRFLLKYCNFRGKIDCIYIDPPYNTGNTNWKYNNRYNRSKDIYKHSSWLEMMEKRLLLAKELLNPLDSILIVTIDEKEVHQLGCVLEQIFPKSKIQMITSIIRPGGVVRQGRFSRVEEYIFFVFIGNARIYNSSTNMHDIFGINNTNIEEGLLSKKKQELVNPWIKLIRTGQGSLRHESPKLFYPLFFDKRTGEFKGVGDSVPPEMPRDKVEIPKGCFAVWPIKKKSNEEARWMLSQKTLLHRLEKGYVRFGNWNRKTNNIPAYYINKGVIESIENGETEIVTKGENIYIKNIIKSEFPFTVWNHPLHNAGDFGTTLLLSLLGKTQFTYPKSLYAVKDAIRFATKGKPNALILDFFAGSGTTLHAVNSLNEEDDGNRRCILITNNEISQKEEKECVQKGLKPSDKEWRDKGIAHSVTWPRTVNSIRGKDSNGNPLKGKYADNGKEWSKGFKSSVIFFTLLFTEKETLIKKPFRMKYNKWMKKSF